MGAITSKLDRDKLQPDSCRDLASGSMDTLPPEILIKICSHLTFESMSLLSATNSTYYRHIQQDDLIFKALASAHLDQQTTSSSASVRLKPPGGDVDLAGFIRLQRSMSTVYDQVGSFKEFAQTCCRIKHNWDTVNCTLRTINLGDTENWRFKLDSDSQMIVTSSINGGYSVHNARGDLLENQQTRGPRYPHIELSEGYLLVSSAEPDVVIYRRSTITSPRSPLSPAQIDTIVDRFGAHQIYIPYIIYDDAASFNCTKLRYPYFCAIRSSTSTVSIWDLSDTSRDTARLTFSIQRIQDRGWITYLDFDDTFLYIVTQRGITVWSMASGQMLQTLKVDSIGGEQDVQWVALHYDSLGRSLVALNRSSKLLWRPRYKAGEIESSLTNQSVVLSLPGLAFEQLCVENGRAVFTTCSFETGRQQLWLLSLDDFSDLDAFRLNPARLTCLSRLLPSFAIIQRIEMTCDEIFVPIKAELNNLSSYAVERDNSRDPLELNAGWYDITGNRLCGVRNENSSDRSMRLRVDDEWAFGDEDQSFNALLVFSFAPP